MPGDDAPPADQQFWVYVLVSEKTGRRYVGSTQDVANRLRQHNSGHSKSTKHGMPWRLAKTESFPSRTEAVRRERYLKTGQGRRELDKELG